MTITASRLLLLVAVICFVLAFLGFEPFAGHSLVDAGLAAFAAAFLV